MGKSFDWPLPLDCIKGFVAWCLSSKHLSAGTVKTYLSALSLAHTLKGLGENAHLRDKLISMMLTGAEKLSLTEPKPIQNARRVMTLPLLRILGHKIASSSWDKLKRQSVWTACLVAFFASARMGEILAKKESTTDTSSELTWGDLKWPDKDSVLLKIKCTKSASKKGEVLDLFAFSSHCCPIAAISKLKKLQNKMGIFGPDSAVFRIQNGKNLTPNLLNKLLKGLLQDTILEGDLISCHSFRAGLTSLLAKHQGVFTSDKIKSWGRWKSGCFERYTRLRRDQKKGIYSRLRQYL